ncbi:hypothetical protein V8D89_010555 [Ganoderma adspersum]
MGSLTCLSAPPDILPLFLVLARRLPETPSSPWPHPYLPQSSPGLQLHLVNTTLRVAREAECPERDSASKLAVCRLHRLPSLLIFHPTTSRLATTVSRLPQSNHHDRQIALDVPCALAILFDVAAGLYLGFSGRSAAAAADDVLRVESPAAMHGECLLAGCPGCEGEDAITSLIDSDGESPALQVDRYQDRRPMFVGFGMGERDTGLVLLSVRCPQPLQVVRNIREVLSSPVSLQPSCLQVRRRYMRRSHGGRYRGLDDLRVIMQEGSTTTKDTGPSTPTRDDVRSRSPAGRLGHVRNSRLVLALGQYISREHSRSRRELPKLLLRLCSPVVLARPPSRVRSERVLAQILLGWLCLCPAASRRLLSSSPPTDSTTLCLHLPYGASSSAHAESSMRKKNARLRTLISRATHPRPRTEIALSPAGMAIVQLASYAEDPAAISATYDLWVLAKTWPAVTG